MVMEILVIWGVMVGVIVAGDLINGVRGFYPVRCFA